MDLVELVEWSLDQLLKVNYNNFEIKHINNRTGPEVSSNLLKHDSIHGKFNSMIKFNKNKIIIGKQKYHFLKKQI